jgi:hypothetical protein
VAAQPDVEPRVTRGVTFDAHLDPVARAHRQDSGPQLAAVHDGLAVDGDGDIANLDADIVTASTPTAIGIDLSYKTHGTGRPLILLHGGLVSGETFGRFSLRSRATR